MKRSWCLLRVVVKTDVAPLLWIAVLFPMAQVLENENDDFS
jgi:hypothetical protein